MDHQTYWTEARIARQLALLEPLVYREAKPLPAWRILLMEDAREQPPVQAQVDDGAWPVVHFPGYWAQWETDFTLRTTFSAPSAWADEPVALHLQLGKEGDFSHPEALAYIDGEPYAGCDRHHQEVLLQPAWVDGRHHRLALHGWTGRGGWPQAEKGSLPLMGHCRLVRIDQPLRALLRQARVALDVARRLEDADPARGRLLNALVAAFQGLPLQEPFGAAFYDSVPAAQERLAAGIAACGPALDVTLFAAGHAHIDIAWLWTVAQARRKAGRTFHTVLRLMEQHDDFHFTQSQPQLYEFVRQDYPQLFAAIKERIADGRWEATGGMWVEADCNISGAEALARQFLLGRGYFRRHFGPEAESPILWLPDVFGYAWALPQLIKQAGLAYFFTTKIGWSQYNRLPYDSFWWQGLDGTRVLTHFSTAPGESGRHASTYNAKADATAVIGAWRNLQQREEHRSMLMTYGYGDGGGGPTRKMLENLQEMAGFPSTPRVKQAKALEFFRALEAQSGPVLPTWNGELYLEYHRGTYTTQARSKRANRRAEFLLHDAEFLAAAASALSDRLPAAAPNYDYPHDELRRAWELLCLNQFHDILPGTSIGEVYEVSLREYGRVEEIATAVKRDALAYLAAQMDAELLLVNPTSFSQAGPVLWAGRPDAGHAWPELAEAALPRGEAPLASQRVAGGTLLDAGPLPPYSFTPLRLVSEYEEVAPPGTVQVSPSRLENDYLRIRVDARGDIVGILDKREKRQLLPPGAVANQLQAFEDRPLNWDAWDVEIYYEQKMHLAGAATLIDVVEEGPLRATLLIERPILNSSVRQRLSLVHNQPQLDIETEVEWRERHTLLKAAFPVEIFSPRATFEIQWGQVERPTHRNTSWDWARFESCAQKWIDLSEADYGASLLNDCKYGHDVQGNVMRISLLRGATFPDPAADLGRHRFAYSLRPHNGPVGEPTIAAAYALNDPPFVYEARIDGGRVFAAGRAPLSLIRSDRPNVIIETIKGAEDGRGVILRLYESQRRRGPVTLTFAHDLQQVWRTDLLETDQERVPHAGREIKLDMRPFEIITLRLV